MGKYAIATCSLELTCELDSIERGEYRESFELFGRKSTLEGVGGSILYVGLRLSRYTRVPDVFRKRLAEPSLTDLSPTLLSEAFATADSGSNAGTLMAFD